LQAAALVTGALLFATLPTVLRLGRGAQPGNDSIVPFAYGPRLAAVLAAVWAVAAAVAVGRSLRDARARRDRRDATRR